MSEEKKTTERGKQVLDILKKGVIIALDVVEKIGEEYMNQYGSNRSRSNVVAFPRSRGTASYDDAMRAILNRGDGYYVSRMLDSLRNDKDETYYRAIITLCESRLDDFNTWQRIKGLK